MKVLIVAFHSRSMTPYSELYENVIKDNNDSYNIIFWDRTNLNKKVMSLLFIKFVL